jgi:hypothetical protein
MKFKYNREMVAVAFAMMLVGGLSAHAQDTCNAPQKCQNATMEKVRNVVNWTVQGHLGKIGGTGAQKITVRIGIEVNEKGKVSVKSAIAVNEALDKKDLMPAIGEDLEKDLKSIKIKAGAKLCEGTIEIIIPRDGQ